MNGSSSTQPPTSQAERLAFFEALARRDSLSNAAAGLAASTNPTTADALQQQAASLFGAALGNATGTNFGGTTTQQQLAALSLPSLQQQQQQDLSSPMMMNALQQNLFSMDTSNPGVGNLGTASAPSSSNPGAGLDKDILDDLYKILNKADPTRDFADNPQALVIENSLKLPGGSAAAAFNMDSLANLPQGMFSQQAAGNASATDPFALLQQAQQNQQQAFQLAEQLQQQQQRRNSLQQQIQHQQLANTTTNSFLQQAGQMDAATASSLWSSILPSSVDRGTTNTNANSVNPQQLVAAAVAAANFGNGNLKKPGQVVVPAAVAAAPPAQQGSSSSNNKLPLRALSAYNFFFRDERDRIVHGGTRELSTDKKKQMLAAHWFRDRSKKRRHRRTHGKIAFTDLSRVISQRWKELDESTKAFYQQVAAEDLERYHRELDQYKMAEAQAAVAANSGGGAMTASFSKDDHNNDGARAA